MTAIIVLWILCGWIWGLREARMIQRSRGKLALEDRPTFLDVLIHGWFLLFFLSGFGPLLFVLFPTSEAQEERLQ